ncbi:type I-E CRISPR-associated protein Cas5/CasD [Methylocaldum sp.]|uniref:type I-E CRISPR-associated protein Cas5/CasD n=1 Tax=Methylocaldum sp. TaxID=1969727 RepID=UPI002D4B1E4F|nr:type I-E CRISPR-associated protein Cas5/CasD [Methylocaldum sp.]HYE36209.1 type I-E CRISPR-associated protein Cas5/CasD [Methylocaldum sp.]
MPEFLIFRLYGPLAAWGDIAVGEQRPTTPHPSKSAVLGLVAAALGIRRHEDDKQQALADGYGYAVRVDAAGVLLRDYHTTQIPESTSRLKHLRTRRDETRDRQNLYTILSARDFRCDGLYTICLWPRGEAAYRPETLAEALRCPRLPLYLGRKACPLALPLLPRCIRAETFEGALAQYDTGQSNEQQAFLDEITKRLDTRAPDYHWDEHAPTELPVLHTTPRHDVPLSRKRWQFGKRNEHYGRGQP